MANDFTQNPWIIDTVTGVSATAAVFDCYLIRWASGSTADTCLVEDVDGNDKFTSTGQSAGHTDQAPHSPPLRFNGLTVSDMTSGRVFIYVNKRLR